MPLLDQIVGFPTLTGVQRSYNWDFILPSFGLLIDGIAVSKYCQACKFGQYDIDEIAELKVGAHQQFFPKGMHIALVTATFICPVPDIVMMYFVKWKKMIIDSDGFYFPSEKYKKNIYVVLYDRSGIPSNFIQLKGAFPYKFPAYSLNYGEEGLVRYDVEFKVDRIQMGLEALGEMAAGVIGGVGKFVGAGVSGVGESIKGFF